MRMLKQTLNDKNNLNPTGLGKKNRRERAKPRSKSIYFSPIYIFKYTKKYLNTTINEQMHLNKIVFKYHPTLMLVYNVTSEGEQRELRGPVGQVLAGRCWRCCSSQCRSSVPSLPQSSTLLVQQKRKSKNVCSSIGAFHYRLQWVKVLRECLI